MPEFFPMHLTKRLLALTAILVTVSPAQVRTEISGPLADTTPKWAGSGAWFRQTFRASDTTVTILPPARLKDFVVDGKLRLSLRHYLELVLTNNTDIAIQRLQLETPKNAIQRAFGVFDPTVTSNFQATRAKSPTTNQLQGATILSNLNQPFNLNFQQLLPSSTTVTTGLNTSKTSTNDTFQLYNPAYTTRWTMGFTQPLLRNRGGYITKLPITIARANRQVADFNFQDQMLRLLTTAENVYWDVVSARERINVNQKALDLAEEALKRARRELELGATSPLEIFQPEQQRATAQINLTQVQFLLRQTEDALRRQIGADLDPDISKLPIELTENVSPELDEKPFEREELVKLALSRRPDYKSNLTTLEVNDMQIRSSLEGLKPVLNLTGSYATQGRGGTFFPRVTQGPIIPVPGGISDAFGQMFGFDFPTYQFGLTLQLPLRDRRAAADLSDAVVTKRLNTLRKLSLEQQIRLDVLNAITNVESSRESVKLAQIAVDYAQKRADADQKRYDLGVINIFFLLAAQTDLTQAQSNLVTQTVQYRRNLLNLQQRLGTLFEERGIILQ
jgi:outer membrane protein TolC